MCEIKMSINLQRFEFRSEVRCVTGSWAQEELMNQMLTQYIQYIFLIPCCYQQSNLRIALARLGYWQDNALLIHRSLV